MKKLMFAAVATLCATVVANADGITSANVVGYMTNDLSNNYSIVCCPFAAMNDTQTVDIQDLIPVDRSTGETKGGGAFQIHMKALNGAISKVYQYYLDDDFDDDCPEGWYWNAGEGIEARESVPFKPGEGIMFKNSGSANGKLTYNGQVLTEALALDVNPTYNVLGNPRAVPVNIQNLIPVLESGETSGGGAFQIQTKLPDGSIGKTYQYYLDDDFDDDCPEGWYWNAGEGIEARENLIFQPGEGFFFKTTKAKSQLTLTKLDL